MNIDQFLTTFFDFYVYLRLNSENHNHVYNSSFLEQSETQHLAICNCGDFLYQPHSLIHNNDSFECIYCAYKENVTSQTKTNYVNNQSIYKDGKIYLSTEDYYSLLENDIFGENL